MKNLRMGFLLLWIVCLCATIVVVDTSLNISFAAPANCIDPILGDDGKGRIVTVGCNNFAKGTSQQDIDDWYKSRGLTPLSSGKNGSAEDATKQAEAMSSFIATLMDQTYKIIQTAAEPFRKVAGQIFMICVLIGMALFGAQAVLSRTGIEDMIKEFLLWMLWVGVCYAAILKRRRSSHARSHRGSPVGKQHSIFAVKEKRNLRAGAFRARVPHAAHDAA